jgi:hypothetical protein
VNVLAPPNQLMALSMALRQAAIDVPKDLGPGVRFAWVFEADSGHVVIQATDHQAGVVAWSQTYTARGQRVR